MKTTSLIENLLIQQGLLKELLALLERETHDLTEMRLDAMAEVNDLKEDVAGRIESHTAELRQVIGEILRSSGLPSDAALGDLVIIFKKQGNKEVPRLHKELNILAERVRQTADINREIAERFAATVNQSLNFLTQILNQSTVYGSSGGYQQRPSGAVMINMEA